MHALTLDATFHFKMNQAEIITKGAKLCALDRHFRHKKGSNVPGDTALALYIKKRCPGKLRTDYNCTSGDEKDVLLYVDHNHIPTKKKNWYHHKSKARICEREIFSVRCRLLILILWPVVMHQKPTQWFHHTTAATHRCIAHDEHNCLQFQLLLKNRYGWTVCEPPVPSLSCYDEIWEIHRKRG